MVFAGLSYGGGGSGLGFGVLRLCRIHDGRVLLLCWRPSARRVDLVGVGVGRRAEWRIDLRIARSSFLLFLTALFITSVIIRARLFSIRFPSAISRRTSTGTPCSAPSHNACAQMQRLARARGSAGKVFCEVP